MDEMRDLMFDACKLVSGVTVIAVIIIFAFQMWHEISIPNVIKKCLKKTKVKTCCYRITHQLDCVVKNMYNSFFLLFDIFT